MVIYNDLCDLEDSVRSLNPAITTFDSSCFSGVYVTPEVTATYLQELEGSGRGHGRSNTANPDAVCVNKVKSAPSPCEGMYNSSSSPDGGDSADSSKRQRLE